jgi:hypothetical protein
MLLCLHTHALKILEFSDLEFILQSSHQEREDVQHNHALFPPPTIRHRCTYQQFTLFCLVQSRTSQLENIFSYVRST